MSPDRLMQILLAPVISEKSTLVGELNQQVVFRVLQGAAKPDIKAAVELMFKVEVDSVRVLNQAGKAKSTARSKGRRSSVRKAYVSLRPGHSINFAELN